MARAVSVWTGLAILCRYDPSATTAAEHDVIYAGDCATHPNHLMPLDRNDLAQLGWEWIEDLQTWRRFT